MQTGNTFGTIYNALQASARIPDLHYISAGVFHAGHEARLIPVAGEIRTWHLKNTAAALLILNNRVRSEGQNKLPANNVLPLAILLGKVDFRTVFVQPHIVLDSADRFPPERLIVVRLPLGRNAKGILLAVADSNRWPRQCECRALTKHHLRTPKAP